MKQSILWVAGLIVAHSVAAPAFAQARPDGCTVDGGGVITGVVVDDSTGSPLPRTWVVLLGPMCRTMTDDAGRFTFRRVAEGGHTLDAGASGYRAFRPVALSVGAADTTEVEFRLKPGAPIADCRALPACSPLLREDAPASLDDDQRLQLAAFGAAIAIAWSHVVKDEPMYACVVDADASVVGALAERYQPIVPAEECDVGSGSPSNPPLRRFRHAATGLPAFVVYIEGSEGAGVDTRTLSLSFVLGPTYAGGWSCEFQRVESGWRVGPCTHVWES